MKEEGLKSLFDISDLAVMGLAEVIPSIPKVLRRIRETVADIAAQKPDIVVTIDSWSFSSRVHKALRRQKIKVPANALCRAAGLGVEKRARQNNV